MILEVSIGEQLWCCLSSALFGIASGIVYDLLRTLHFCFSLGEFNKRISIINYTVTFFTDLAYAVIISISFAVLVYACSDGRFRVIYIIFASVAFILYHLSFSKALMFTLKKLVNLLKLLLNLAFKCVLLPLTAVWSILSTTVKFIYNRTAGRLFTHIRLKRHTVRAEKLLRSKISDYIKI